MDKLEKDIRDEDNEITAIPVNVLLLIGKALASTQHGEIRLVIVARKVDRVVSMNSVKVA